MTTNTHTIKLNNFLKISGFFTLLLLALTTLQAQNTTETIKVSGTVVTTKNNPLEGASVVVWGLTKADSTQTDSTTTKRTETSVATTKAGKFSLEIVPLNVMYIEITSIGYADVFLPLEYIVGDPAIDLGEIPVQEAATALTNVVVTAKKPFMELGVDRRTFNADAVITAKGGTAVDLMRNIPGLSVDVNGGVQLRNSSPQIFVDGRPTLLTLEQIPSDDIEKVEVITNPSARYDAGSTGGIINVVLKKNRRRGLNGIASAGLGYPGISNAGLSLNYRQGKLNFFVSGNHNQRGGIANSAATRINKSNGTPTDFFEQTSLNDRNRRFANVRAGVDYFIDKYNSLSVSRQFTDGRFSSVETQEQRYFDLQNNLIRTGERLSNDNFNFKRDNVQVNYRKTYEQEGKEWTADFTYGGSENSGTNNIVNSFFDPAGRQIGNDILVRNDAMGSGDQYTFQTDYVNPISEDSRLELGARFFQDNSRDKLDVFSIANGGESKLPLSNNYRFQETVYAVYGNYSNKFGEKWKYQTGLRIEQSTFEGELIDSARTFGYDYPGKGTSFLNAFFPSLFLTYTPVDGHDLQANFSRRIRRPNFWQINPFVDINDPQNIRQGNPNLRPEFTNSFELNYNRVYDKGNVFVSAYYRNNTADITAFTDTISNEQLAQFDNAAVDPNALLTTFINADRTNRMGLEITWQHKFSDAFDITPNFNAQYRDVKAQVNGINLSNTGFNWTFRTTANYKIIKPGSPLINNLSFQLQGEYESGRVMAQGRQLSQNVFDFAIRKDLLKDNKGTITFNVNDIFNNRRRGMITDTESFYQESFRRWNVRNIRLTFSYRFGDNDFQIFKRRDGDGDDRDS